MITQNKVSALNDNRQFQTDCAIIDDPAGQAIRDKMHRQIQELMRASGNSFGNMGLDQVTVA